MTIKAKSDATIVAKTSIHYDPASFEEHKQPNFIDATAEQVLDCIKPICFDFLPDKKAHCSRY